MRLEGRVNMCAPPCWPPRASAAGMVPWERLAMPDFFHEDFHDGPVAGVDEAGRGPLAGPVVAAAVILDRRAVPDGLNDSKQLAPRSEEQTSELQSLMRISDAVFFLKKKKQHNQQQIRIMINTR